MRPHIYPPPESRVQVLVCAVAAACLAGGKSVHFFQAYYDLYRKYPNVGEPASHSKHFKLWAEKRDFVPAPRGSCDNGMRIFEPR